MVDVIKKAQERARNAIESTYFGVATVIEKQKVKDERSKLTTDKPVVVLENQPCKLSFETISVAAQGETAASIKQIVKLFISPDVSIKAGSKITITQDGVTADYTYSGVPAVYATHQEIMLDLLKRWA